MALKTFQIVQGLSRTPLLFIPRYLTDIFFKNMLQQWKIDNEKLDNLNIQKTRFTNRSQALAQERYGKPAQAAQMHPRLF